MMLSRIGRISKALAVSVAVVLGMSACGGYTVGFMWVTGTQFNQIAGFKIDDFTGNLTRMVNSPYSSGGANPVSIVVGPAGRFVFVVNKGTSTGGVSNGDGNVSVFGVGEDGVLNFLQSYPTSGNTPIWATADSGGSYLYVLDQHAPAATAQNPADGDITVFSIDPNTGRLQLVPNQLIKITTGPQAGQQLNYFEVGPAPTMVRVGGGCVYTLDSGDQSILPYGVGSQGQLVVESNSRTLTQTINMTSINAFGSNVYITDAGNNTIKPYTTGSSCSLSAQVDGPAQNLPQTANPVYSMTDSRGKFLYVLNHGTTNSNNANSTISAFVIQATGALTPLSDGNNNPYPVGNGPMCMVEDPSSQYVYTANQNDGSVTGKRIDTNTGQLFDLPRGSSFQATGLATCLGVSGNVD